MLIQLLAVLLVFVIVWYAIGVLPIPASPDKPPPIPIKAILYVLDCVVASYFILKIAGLV